MVKQEAIMEAIMEAIVEAIVGVIMEAIVGVIQTTMVEEPFMMLMELMKMMQDMMKNR